MNDREQLLATLTKERAARLEAERRLKEISDAHTLEMAGTASRLSYLIANMQPGVLVEDENRQIVLVNDSFCRMFNIPVAPDALIGVDCSGSADDSKHLFLDPEAFVHRINEILKVKEQVLGEILELTDGRTFTRDYVPIYIEHEYKGHFWKYIDITPQKQSEKALMRSEEKYRLLIENMNLGLLEVDLEGRIIYANASFCKMSGYSREEMYGNVAENIFTSEDNRALVRSKTASRRNGILDAYELQVTNPYGEVRWWMISGAPLFNHEGVQIGSTGIHLDITEHKMLEFNLRDAKQLAEESARAKEIFLANMSHEIRTPMNAILGLGQQLTKTRLNLKQSAYLDSINSAADNLLVVINDILDFSKIESGKLNLERINFSLPLLASQLTSILAGKAAEKNLQLKLEVDPCISPLLIGDPYRINQVLINLLGNAIKFTSKGEVKLSCKVLNQHSNIQEVEIGVYDTGIGMEKQYLKSIFRKFSQESIDIARKYGGTGLGMAISKQLIDLMEGTIEIESTKNVGTTISISLRLPIGMNADLNETSEMLKDYSFLKGKHILLVEDNKVNRLVAQAIMKPFGIKVTEAINGELAIDQVKSTRFDLILMDVQMPVLDGISATEVIRKEINKQIPVIALTAHALKSEEARCHEAGMNDFISKPFTEEKLLSTILKHLHTK